jgi:metal-dependent amidase/aminoacylase/carboxypeptidase family protein
MTGTIRTLDQQMRTDIHARVKRTADLVAKSFGASAEVDIRLGYPVTFNHAVLTAQMAPVLDRVSAGENAIVIKPVMGAKDFSYFANQIPALFIGLGVADDSKARGESASNHPPYFYVNDKALPVGVKALSRLALDWLNAQKDVL